MPKDASHRVSSAIGGGALPPCDAEAEALVVSHQAGGESLQGPAGCGLQVEGNATAASLPREVVVLGPQWRGGDGVLRLHHALPQHRHGDADAGAAQSLNRRVVLGLVQIDPVHLREEGWGRERSSDWTTLDREKEKRAKVAAAKPPGVCLPLSLQPWRLDPPQTLWRWRYPKTRRKYQLVSGTKGC